MKQYNGKKMAAGFAIAVLIMALSTCGDYSTADSSIDGTWLSLGGIRLTLANGSYTRATRGGLEEQGTFSTEGSAITFTRSGAQAQVYTYVLQFPSLWLDTVQYFHDSPAQASAVEGRWFPIDTQGSVWFGKAERKRTSPPGELEGAYEIHQQIKGVYKIRSRNLPGIGTIDINPTHVHGTQILTFVTSMLPINLYRLFDHAKLEIPVYGTADWWWNMDEVRLYFEAAAEKADNFMDATQIMGATEYFYTEFDSGFFDYTIEADENYDSGDDDFYLVAPGYDNKLVLRTARASDVHISEYRRMGGPNIDAELVAAKNITITGIPSTFTVGADTHRVFDVGLQLLIAAPTPHLNVWNWGRMPGADLATPPATADFAVTVYGYEGLWGLPPDTGTSPGFWNGGGNYFVRVVLFKRVPTVTPSPGAVQLFPADPEWNHDLPVYDPSDPSTWQWWYEQPSPIPPNWVPENGSDINYTIAEYFYQPGVGSLVNEGTAWAFDPSILDVSFNWADFKVRP